MKRIVLILLTLAIGFTFAQDSVSVPLDSVLKNGNLHFGQRFVLTRLANWQHFSYGNDDMNCQFEPSCSNFMAQSILEKGVLPGIISGTDRVLRCNSHAVEHHLQHDVAAFHFDGRIYEPIQYKAVETPQKSPFLAALFSTVLPGSGRCYAGNPYDGKIGFVLTSALAGMSYWSYASEHPISGALFASTTTFFWTVDI